MTCRIFVWAELVCISNQMINRERGPTSAHSRELPKYIQLGSFDYVLPSTNSKDSRFSKRKEKGRWELLRKQFL